jgi:hypothetical protein
MATIRLSNLGGDWSLTTTWDGGVIPGKFDAIIADANSGPLISTTRPACQSFDFRTYTNTLTVTAYFTVAGISGGSVDCHFGPNMSFAGTNYIYFMNTTAPGGGVINLYSHGVTITGPQIRLSTADYEYNSTVRLQDDLTLTTQLAGVGSGKFDANRHTVTCSGLILGSATTPVEFIFADLYLTGTGNIISAGGRPAGSFTCTGTVYVTNISTTGKAILMPNNRIDKLFVASGGLGNSGLFTFSSDLEIGTLYVEYPKTLIVFAGKTLTLDAIVSNGIAGELITLRSGSATVPFYVNKTSGMLSVDYWSIRDSIASGGASFYAGSHSVDVSGNTGWIFTDPPRFLSGKSVFNGNPFGGNMV